MVSWNKFGNESDRLLQPRQLVILLIAVGVIAIGLGLFIYYRIFYLSVPLNPILGQWRSAEPYFGQIEVLNFTSDGLVRDGRFIKTSYRIKGTNKVTVETNSHEYQYIVSSDGLRLFIYQPRVGKMTYNRVSPLPDTAH
ncbi:DUF2850 domain-containing protein [Celerinatantimonas sp. YJH-8]|uniref:DUF2850 domain-containing protein n=1 Tax=Celerinatantimonas sp. YJH-8 TaxID=3228714 RepID=UPI0038BEC115